MPILQWEDSWKNRQSFRIGAFMCDSCEILVYVPKFTKYDQNIYELTGKTICTDCIIDIFKRTIGLTGRLRWRSNTQKLITNPL